MITFGDMIQESWLDDQRRKMELIERLKLLTGLDEATYRRVLFELEQNGTRARGWMRRDASGSRFFDAKPRDMESFDAANKGSFALHYVRAALSVDTAYAAQGSKVVCIFVNDTCDAPVVEKLAAFGVELIALRCAGFNNVDLEACQRHDISVVRVPAYSPYAVAEFTVALMMMLNRRLHHAYMRNRSGNFVLEGLDRFRHARQDGGSDRHRARSASARSTFCWDSAVTSWPTTSIPIRRWPTARTCEYVDLEHLLPQSDIITLHVPLFLETYHLINREAIERMKTGVMLINTSRGGLVDTKALIDGLKAGKIGSAGLDVYEEEAGIFFHDMSDKVLTDDVLARLMTFNNVVVTSHQAFLTREALANIAETTLANIGEYCAGKRGADLPNAGLRE